MSDKKNQKTGQFGFGNTSETTINQSIEKGQLVLTEEIYKQSLENAVKVREGELRDAHVEERAILQAQIDELKSRKADPEKALQDEQELKIKIRADLERESNEIGAGKLAEADAALEIGDFSKATAIFTKIKNYAKLEEERSARASFALGKIAEQQVRWKDAFEHYARAAQLAPCFDNLIMSQKLALAIGEYDFALSFSEEAKKAAITEYGEESKEHATSLSNLGLVHMEQKKYDLAGQLHKKSLKLREDILGKKHPDVAVGLNNLGGFHFDQKHYKEAKYLFNRALNIHKETLGMKHLDTANTLNNLGGAYRALGEFKKAITLLKKALNIRKKILGYNHPFTANSFNNIGGIYYRQRQYKMAEKFCRQALEIYEITLGLEHPDTKSTRANYELLKKDMANT